MTDKQILQQAWEHAQSSLSTISVDSFPPLESMFDSVLLYWKLLQRWNAKIRLTGIHRIEEYAFRHLTDSWMGWWYLSNVPPGQSFLDVGTGAGFPGVPLALLRSDLSWTWVESHQRRAAFLQQIKRELGLSWVEVKTCWMEGEPAQEGLPTSFDGLTFRAVAPEQILPIAHRYLTQQGVALYWGTSSFSAPALPHLLQAQTFPYQLPNHENFSLFLFKQL